MKIKQLLLENSIQRTAALKLQQKLIDSGEHVSVKKYGPDYGGVYCLASSLGSYWYVTTGGMTRGWGAPLEAIVNDVVKSVAFASQILEGPFPAGEKVILSSPEYSYYYAAEALKKPWPEGEPVIVKDSDYAYYYAREVLKAPFPAGEPAIATDGEYSYYYANHILKAPFPAGEPAIARSANHAYHYAVHVLKAPFPAGEEAINGSIYEYDYNQFFGRRKHE